MIRNLTPSQSWELLQSNPKAIMIDVRTAIEHSFVGHPPKAIHIAWKEFPGMQENSQFIAQVEATVEDKTSPVLLLCRSGQRSLAAAHALEKAGFEDLVNITEGFEGSLDDEHHRGHINGWKYHQLPWIQS